jgi:hypothetical protein
MPRPKVFVTRVIPAIGLDRIRGVCDADIWTEQLPPPRNLLLQMLKCSSITANCGV